MEKLWWEVAVPSKFVFVNLRLFRY